MAVKAASNINRTILLQRSAGNMLSVAPGSSIDSDVADFRSMLVGSFQVVWENTDSIDSEFEIFVSNYPAVNTFGKYPSSRLPMDAACNGILWNIGDMGFRYGFVRFYRGLTLTTGDMEIVALAKR